MICVFHLERIFGIRAGLIKRLTLTSLFYWMSLFADLNKILVLREIGLLSLSTKGDIVWSYDARDIITSVVLVAPLTLRLSYFEGGESTLDRKILDQTHK